MVGVRIRHLPDQTIDKVLKIYFSKPEHGGGKIQRIYFPLMNNDAVIIFEDPKVIENITKFQHKMSGNDLEIEVLPEHMIFSTMEAKVDTNASVILQVSQKLRDEMEFGENIKITQNEDGTYSLKGNWFQLEWAWNYLSACMKHQEVIQSQIKQTSNSQQSAAAMEIDDKLEDKWRTYRVRPASPSDVNTALRKNIADRAKSEELVRSPKSRRQPDIDRSLETNISQNDRSRGQGDVFEGYEEKSPHDEVLMYQKSIGSPHESLRESPQSSFKQSPSSQRPSTSKARDTDTSLAGLTGKENINHSYGLSSLNRASIYRDNPDNYDTDDELESLRGKEHIVPFESVHSSLGIGNQERKSDENKTFEQFSGMSLSHSRHKSLRESAGQNTDPLYSGGQSHSDTSLWRTNYYNTAGTGLDGARSMFDNKDDSLYGATASSSLDRSTETKVDKLKTGSASTRSQSDLPDRYTNDQLQSTFSIRNVTVTVCHGDLLQETTDCIVNPADNKLDHLGGVAYAIAQARGPEMGIECREYIRKNGSLAVSEVTHTSGGGKIKALYIMHTVGPLWLGEQSKEKTANQLRETFLNCFVYGETKLGIKSLSTPAISTGVYGVALDLCVRCFLDAVLVFVDKNSVKSLTDIRLVSNDEESTVTAIVLLQTLLEAGIENLTAEAVESHNQFTNKSRMNLPRGRPETTDFSRSYLSSPRFDGTSDISRGQHRRSMSASRVSDRRGAGGQTQKSSNKDTNSYVVDSSRLEDRARTKTRSSTESKTPSAHSDKLYGHSGHSSKTVPQIKPNLLPSKSRLATSKSSNLSVSKTQTRHKTSAVRVGNERPRTSHLADSSYDDNYAHSYAGKLYTDDEGLDRDDSDFGLQSLPANFDKHNSSFREKFLQLNSEEKSNKKVNLCAICLDKVRNPKVLSKCGHTFCAGCIDEYFHKDKPKCPTCGVIYGQIKGDQPKGGTMNCKTDRKLLIPGYEREDGTIIIQYTFPSGIQEACHPHPGRSYKGISRKAYLPNSVEGREVLRLLKKAFHARLTFTIGESRTTGESGLITWNDIHHKTNIDGGPTNFGYPDSTYLKRVKEELADKGIIS